MTKYLFILAVLGLFAGLAGAQDFTLDNSGPLEFDVGQGSSDNTQIHLTNQTGGSIKLSITAKTQTGGAWLSFSLSQNPVASGNTATITVRVDSSRLEAQNTYHGTVSITDGNTKVNVAVNLGVDGVIISVPNSESITLVQGSTGTVTVPVKQGPSSLIITTNQAWLSSDGTGQAPGGVNITVDATTLDPGGHNGSVTFQCSGGSPCLAKSVPILANVTPSNSLKANVSSLTFQAFAGRGDPDSQGFQVTTTSGGQLTFSATPNAPWLKTSISGVASSNPAIVTASVSAALLSSGSNAATISVNTTNGSQPVFIPVNATLSPFSINIANPAPVAVASGKTETVPLQVNTADGRPANLAIAAQTKDGSAWLKAPAAFAAPNSLNVTVDASQLNQGNYSGSLTLTCTDATCAPAVVPFTVTVSAGTPVPTLNAVVGAGLSVPPINELSQDGLVSLFGSGFADASVSRNVTGSDLSNNALPTNLANTCVEGNKVRWGLIYVSATQINAVANPMSTSGSVPVTVIRNCGQPNAGTSAPLNVNVAAQAPQFLLVSGSNEVVAIEPNGAKIGPTGLIPGVTFVQAKANDIVTAFGVGWGATSPAAVVGSIAPNGTADLTGSHSLTVGTKAATISYAGLAPGFAGLYQINFEVPSGLKAGNQPIVLTVDGAKTPATATIAVK